jgi:hypothetical protein
MSLLVQLVKTSNDSLISPLRYAKEPIVAILYVIDKMSSIVKLIDIGVLGQFWVPLYSAFYGENCISCLLHDNK